MRECVRVRARCALGKSRGMPSGTPPRLAGAFPAGRTAGRDVTVSKVRGAAGRGSAAGSIISAASYSPALNPPGTTGTHTHTPARPASPRRTADRQHRHRPPLATPGVFKSPSVRAAPSPRHDLCTSPSTWKPRHAVVRSVVCYTHSVSASSACRLLVSSAAAGPH